MLVLAAAKGKRAASLFGCMIAFIPVVFLTIAYHRKDFRSGGMVGQPDQGHCNAMTLDERGYNHTMQPTAGRCNKMAVNSLTRDTTNLCYGS